MKTIRIIFYLITVQLFGTENIKAQACCTAGTPLLGTLQMTTVPDGLLQIGLTYDHNSLNDVLAGSNTLRNNERERISQSVLLEINYGLSRRITITGLFSYNKQQRTIFNDIRDNKLSAAGLGDVAIIGKYSLVDFDQLNRQVLSIGGGIKIPTGSSSLKNRGILIPADMQPGSGSWDGLLWSYFSNGGFLLTDLTLLGNLSYRINGNNSRFENSSKNYKFGNEFIAILGFSYPIYSLFDFIILSKYRTTVKDSFGNQAIPNTGGNWIYFKPALNIYLGNNLTSRIGGEIPLYRSVHGTQLTTTFTASVSLFYSIYTSEGSLL